MNIITYDQFDYSWFRFLDDQPRNRGNQGSRQKYYYKDVITAFDIETTRIKEIEQAVMYIWQWQFGDKCTVIGRTWSDMREFMRRLRECMGPSERLFIVVHNLSYEFQFLAGMYPFDPEEVFAVEPRRIVRCSMYDNIFEFRCSYFHSNMSLLKYMQSVGVEHEKLQDFDYSIERYWYTELTDRELEYCVNDVRGLVEAVTKEMERDGDNMYTWPLTSTGYVRRDIKKALQEVRHTLVGDIVPDLNVYQLLREEFRGGNTHANRFYVSSDEWDTIVEQAHSADRSSSYPDVVCNDLFPMSRFYYMEHLTLEELEDLIGRRQRAVVFRCRMYDISLRDPYWPVPYISKSKCRNVSTDAVIDNGRVLSASYLETTLNDIDLRILLDEYNFNMEPIDGAHARYGPLPDPIRSVTIEYYRRKTELKNVEGEEYFYNKSKNKLNSIYGCMAQDPVKFDIKFEAGEFSLDLDSKTTEELLEEHNRNAVMPYQWGCWVTSWARYKLEEGIRLAQQQGEFLYCDTDSVKYLGTVDFSGFNREATAASKRSGAYAADPAGVTHYMGVYEQEEDMLRFKTLGAKKYAYEDMKGKLHITIAGVNKKKGAEELKAAGGLEALKDGFVFREAGGTESVYNDFPDIDRWRTPEGDEIRITRNVVIKETTKTIGLTQEYKDLLTRCRRNYIDI